MTDLGPVFEAARLELRTVVGRLIANGNNGGDPLKCMAAAAVAMLGQVTSERDGLAARLAVSEALLEGMTTEAKRHAALADLAGRAAVHFEQKGDRASDRVFELEAELARAHAHHMFAVDVDGAPADRVGALYYLRNHGLPEATPDDLDAACEGLETPWGSRPSCRCGPGDKCWVCCGA